MKNKSLILFFIFLFNISFLSFAKAEDDLSTVLDDLNTSKTALTGSTKAGKQTAINLEGTITLINSALEDIGNLCEDSLGLASNQISETISTVNSRICKSNKKTSKKSKCIPVNVANGVKTNLENSFDLLNSLLETDDNFDGVADVCESNESTPSPTPNASPSSSPSTTSQNQEIGTCSASQQLPPIEDMELDSKTDFTHNLGKIEIYRFADNDGAVFKIKNTALIAIEVMIELKPDYVNVQPTIPDIISVNASSSITAFKICPISNAVWNYSGYTYSTKIGSATNIYSGDGKYILPFPAGQTHEVIQGENGTFSHFGDNLDSIDFGMPEGTTVTAMRSGTVIAIKEDSNEGGPDKDTYVSKANFIWVLHEDNSIGYYYHLKQNGALVEMGMKVKAGDIIGLSGNTGYSSGPHLHVQVVLPKGFSGLDKIPIRFKGIDGALVEGEFYTAS